MAETYRLRLYADDGVTVAVEYSTDPAHARPYLLAPENLVGQSLDFAAGRSSIGSCSVEIVDVRTDPADQDTGHVTSILPAASGYSARIGRRAQLEVLIAAVYENVIDGPIDDIELHESYSSFTLRIKDQRENERKTRAFTTANTSAVSPRGVVENWGLLPNGDYLAPAVVPHVAEFGLAMVPIFGFTVPVGVLLFEPVPKVDGKFRPPVSRIITPKMLEAFAVGANDSGLPAYTNIRIMWRNVGGGAWNVIRKPLYSGGAPFLTQRGVYARATGAEIEVGWLDSFAWFTGGGPVPVDGASVEVIFAWDGEPTEEYPLHLQGTFGSVLAALYDGTYSDAAAASPVRYDPAAVAALSEPLLARITAPVADDDGIWKHTETHYYAPLGAVPALDSAGLISPVRDELPAAGAALVELNDNTCEAMPGWTHGAAGAVNVVSITYPRFYRVPEELDPLGERAGGDGIAKVDVTITHKDIASIAILGEQPLEFEAYTLGAAGGIMGEPITGDVANEAGAQIAAKRTRTAMDRRLYGPQRFAVMALRSAVGTVRNGQYFIGGCSWWPDYAIGQRGPDRLLQAERVEPIGDIGYAISLIDCGPDGVALAVPTISVGALAADGSVPVTVLTVPAGAEARIDYAIAAAAPAADSPLWRFAGRKAAAGVVTIPPITDAIWIRARSEKAGRRPSAWTAAVNVAYASRAGLIRFSLYTDPITGLISARWTPNAYTLGVRLYYQMHAANEPIAPVLSVDVSAAAGTYAFPAVITDSDDFLTVDAEPWTGWTPPNVSGTSGPVSRRSTAGTVGLDSASPIGIQSILRVYSPGGFSSPPDGTFFDIWTHWKGVAIGRWDAWVSIGANWPTLDGTGTQSSTPDPSARVGGSIPSHERLYPPGGTFTPGSGTYRLITRGYNRFNDAPTPFFFASGVIAGGTGETRDPEIENVYVYVVGGVTHRMTWMIYGEITPPVVPWTVDITYSLEGAEEKIAVQGLDANLELYDFAYPFPAGGSAGLQEGTIIYTIYVRNAGVVIFRAQAELIDLVIPVDEVIS